MDLEISGFWDDPEPESLAMYSTLKFCPILIAWIQGWNIFVLEVDFYLSLIC